MKNFISIFVLIILFSVNKSGANNFCSPGFLKTEFTQGNSKTIQVDTFQGCFIDENDLNDFECFDGICIDFENKMAPVLNAVKLIEPAFPNIIQCQFNLVFIDLPPPVITI